MFKEENCSKRKEDYILLLWAMRAVCCTSSGSVNRNESSLSLSDENASSGLYKLHSCSISFSVHKTCTIKTRRNYIA
jgi:hypothetical protein